MIHIKVKAFIAVFLLIFLYFNSMMWAGGKDKLILLPLLNEALISPLDSGWKLGYSNHQQNKYIQEYIRDGESIDGWSELITFNMYTGLQKNANSQQWIDKIKVKLSQTLASPKNLHTKVLRNNSADSLLEWSVQDDLKIETQYELMRVLTGKEGIYLIRYTSKRHPINKEKWLRFVNAATLVNKQDYNQGKVNWTRIHQYQQYKG